MLIHLIFYSWRLVASCTNLRFHSVIPHLLTSSAPAPGEAEIQVYVNRGKAHIELECQGAYTTLKPHEQLSWTVRWYLLPVTCNAEPSAELIKTVRKIVR